MHSPVQRVVFHPLDTMRSETSPPSCSQKYAVKCALRPIYSLWHPTNLVVPQPTVRMVQGWGGRYQKTYFDVRVFNPLASSNRNQAPAAVYRKHELEKKWAHQQRIPEVEHSSFTPLVLSATGGMSNEATTFYKPLASLHAQNWDFTYHTTLCWLRCHLSFSLLRSSIQAIRGARSSQGHAVRSPRPST